MKKIGEISINENLYVESISNSKYIDINSYIFEYPEITQYFSDHIPHITYESSRAFKECLDYIEADIESVINLK